MLNFCYKILKKYRQRFTNGDPHFLKNEFQAWLYDGNIPNQFLTWMGRVKTTLMMCIPGLSIIANMSKWVKVFLWYAFIADAHNAPWFFRIIMMIFATPVALPVGFIGLGFLSCLLTIELAARLVALPITVLTYPLRRPISHFIATTMLRNMAQLCKLTTWYSGASNNPSDDAVKLTAAIETQLLPPPSQWWPIKVAEAIAYGITWPLTMLATPIGSLLLIHATLDKNFYIHQLTSKILPAKNFEALFSFIVPPSAYDNHYFAYKHDSFPKRLFRFFLLPPAMALSIAAAAIALPAAIVGFALGVLTWPFKSLYHAYKKLDLKTEDADLQVPEFEPITTAEGLNEQATLLVKKHTNEIIRGLKTHKQGASSSDSESSVASKRASNDASLSLTHS